jgi:hypothetical protein
MKMTIELKLIQEKKHDYARQSIIFRKDTFKSIIEEYGMPTIPKGHNLRLWYY